MTLLTDNGKTFLHKVVYIDKPLVNQKMTVREKNGKFHKAALKTLVCNMLKSHWLGSKRSEVRGEIQPVVNVKKEKGKNKSANQSTCKKTKPSKVSDDFFSSGDVEMDSLETFGMSAGLTRPSKQTGTKMPSDNVVKPKSPDGAGMSPREIHTEFTAEPFVKVETAQMDMDTVALGTCKMETSNLPNDKVATDDLARSNIATDKMATGNMATRNTSVSNKPTEKREYSVDVKERVSVVSDRSGHERAIDTNVGNREGQKVSVEVMVPEKKGTDAPILNVKVEKDGEEKSLQGQVLKTVETVPSHQVGVSNVEKTVTSVNQTEVSKDLVWAGVARESEVDGKSLSVESHVSVLDDEFEEEVIVIRRRRGRPTKAPASPGVVKTEGVTERAKPVEETKIVPLKDVKQEKITPVAMAAPEVPSGGKMCLRRSPRVLQRKTATAPSKIPDTPVPKVSESAPHSELPREDPVAKLFASDGHSTETSDDDKLVIAEQCSAPTPPTKTYSKGGKSDEVSVVKDETGRLKSVVSTDSSDEESPLIIDTPELVEPQKSTRRRSLRISAMSAAESTDADTEADTPKPTPKRTRKTRSKKAEAKTVPETTNLPPEVTEKRRSGRLAAKDKAR